MAGQHHRHTGPGSFTDINNANTFDYIYVNSDATIGNITNANAGVLNGANMPTNCCISLQTSSYGANIHVDSSTVTGNITNNGTISQTNTSFLPISIDVTGTGSVGGNIVNNGQMTAMSSNLYATSVFVDVTASVIGNIINSGTMTASGAASTVGVWNMGSIGGFTNAGTFTATGGGSHAFYNDYGSVTTGNITNSGTIITTGENFGWAWGLENHGTIDGNITNSGTILVTSTSTNGSAFGISNDGTILGNITNTGIITATGQGSGTGYSIYHQGSAVTINQNAGQLNGSIQLSGNGDILNINGGTVTGSIFASNADQVNFTGGTLTLLAGGGINSVSTYTQSAGADLVVQYNGTSGPAMISAGTVSLDGTLHVAPEAGSAGSLVGLTYTDFISASTNLTGVFSSVISDSAQFIASAAADGSAGYNLTLRWLGGTNPHIADVGSGSFADIINSVTLDYIAVAGGGTIGNITNTSSGVINGTALPLVKTNCCGLIWSADLSVDASTVTGNITNDGSINRPAGDVDVGAIIIANASTVGGNVVNNGQITITATDRAAGILNDVPSTITGSIINSGTITTTGTSNLAYGIAQLGSVSGSISNTGTINTTGNSYAYSIFNVGSIGGNLTNSGAINANTANGTLAFGIYNYGTISGNLNNSGTITATTQNGSVCAICNYTTISGSLINSGTIAIVDNGTSNSVIYNQGTITGGITNTGTVTAGRGDYAIISGGTALIINQNAGNITGVIVLSGSDTLNVNNETIAGTVQGGNLGGTSDQVNLNGGTLTITPTQSVNNIGSYTQGASGHLSLGYNPSTGAAGFINASTISLNGTLVISPQASSGPLSFTYADIIDATTSLTGSFSSVTSDSAQFAVSLVADGSKAYDLVVKWLGGSGPHIADVGPGSFADINNTITLDYIGVAGGATIGNITNASTGVINGTVVPVVITQCCGFAGDFAGSLSVDASTVTGNITNNGSISQTNSVNTDAGILITNGSGIGGSITNNGTMTISGSGSYAIGIFIDSSASVVGNVVNTGTITASGASNGAFGIWNEGTITGNVVNSNTISTTGNNPTDIINYGTITGALSNTGTLTAMATNGNVFGAIYTNGTITGGVTNTGTITAIAPAGTALAIDSVGSALTINQNAGSITGNIHLSGNGDTLNINGGTVAGSITGSSTDQVNFTGGTLTLPGDGGITGVNSYTQGSGANLIFHISAAGSSSVVATDTVIAGTLVIDEQGGGFITPHTYADVIEGSSSLTGSFSTITSASAQYTVNLVADGSNAYDLVVTWLGGTGSHIIDTGPGTFADIYNTVMLDYITLSNATIGNITNAMSGLINGATAPFLSTDFGTYSSSLGVDNSTVTGNVTNNGTITQTNNNGSAAGIVVTNSSTIGGNIANNGSITITSVNSSGFTEARFRHLR